MVSFGECVWLICHSYGWDGQVANGTASSWPNTGLYICFCGSGVLVSGG